MTDTIQKIADDLKALAIHTADHGISGWNGHDKINAIASRLRALSARASAGEGGELTVDVSKVSAAEATALGNADFANFLRYLAGGELHESSYQVTFAEAARRIATAAPQPAQAGACGGGDEHPYRQLQKWWEDGEPIPTLTIPDWAIASAYRQAVSKIVGPYFRAPNALPWAADITVAADWAAQEWRKKHPDYALDPLALAEWIRIHHRCSEVKDWERLPPELLWIYESLQRLAKLESTPATPATGDAATWEEEIRRHDATPPAHGDGDWYTDADTGSHHVDWDNNPVRQLSVILKKDGKIGWAAYIDGERLHGPDAMAPEFIEALQKLTTRPTPEAQPPHVGEVIAEMRQEQDRAHLGRFGHRVRDWADRLSTHPTPEAQEAMDAWIPVSERLPDDGTECLVLVQYGTDPKVYVAIDTWRMQREAPVSFSSATIETGLMWDEHDFLDVLMWQPIKRPSQSAIDAALALPAQGEGDGR